MESEKNNSNDSTSIQQRLISMEKYKGKIAETVKDKKEEVFYIKNFQQFVQIVYTENETSLGAAGSFNDDKQETTKKEKKRFNKTQSNDKQEVGEVNKNENPKNKNVNKNENLKNENVDKNEQESKVDRTKFNEDKYKLRCIDIKQVFTQNYNSDLVRYVYRLIGEMSHLYSEQKKAINTTSTINDIKLSPRARLFAQLRNCYSEIYERTVHLYPEVIHLFDIVFYRLIDWQHIEGTGLHYAFRNAFQHYNIIDSSETLNIYLEQHKTIYRWKTTHQVDVLKVQWPEEMVIIYNDKEGHHKVWVEMELPILLKYFMSFSHCIVAVLSSVSSVAFSSDIFLKFCDLYDLTSVECKLVNENEHNNTLKEQSPHKEPGQNRKDKGQKPAAAREIFPESGEAN